MSRSLAETLNHYICGHLLVMTDSTATCAACGHEAPYTVFQYEPWCPGCEATIAFCAILGLQDEATILENAINWPQIMPSLTFVGAVERFSDGRYRIVVQAPLKSEVL